MRQTVLTRNTNETCIQLSLSLEGSGLYQIDSGVGFLDHMLELFTRHGRFNLTLHCEGDLRVDAHHTVEDVGIALGQAFDQVFGDKAGITRYGHVVLPMDEALIQVALDVSGRAHLSYGLQLPTAKVGDFDTELVQEFFAGFCRSAGLTLHLTQWAGSNTHHIIEGAFKGFARALAQAVVIDPALNGEIPSTKGVL